MRNGKYKLAILSVRPPTLLRHYRTISLTPLGAIPSGQHCTHHRHAEKYALPPATQSCPRSTFALSDHHRSGLVSLRRTAIGTS